MYSVYFSNSSFDSESGLSKTITSRLKKSTLISLSKTPSNFNIGCI